MGMARTGTLDFIKTCVAAVFILFLIFRSANGKKSSDCYTKHGRDIYSAEEKCTPSSHTKLSREHKNLRLVEMEYKLSKLQRDLESTIKDCNFGRESNIQQFEQKLFALERTLNEERQKIKEIRNNIEQLEGTAKSYKDKDHRTREMCDKLKLNLSSLHSKTQELEKKFMEKLDQSSQANDRLTESLNTLQKINTDNQKKIDHQRELIESLKRDNSKLSEDVDHLSTNLSEVTKNTEYLKRKTADLDRKVALTDLNIQDIVACAGFVFIIGALFIVGVYAYRKRTYQVKETTTSVPQSNAVPPEPSLRQSKAGLHTPRRFPVSRVLDNTVGIVSFGESGSDLHREIIDSVTSKAKISVKFRHTKVRREDEISTIPPSKIVFVFVDANSRHIILENPDQEIGDFRRQSTEAILGMGCDVFVLYVRDEEVPGESLYHSRLTSIERHQLLSSLRSKNRVLSLNLSLSDYQRRFLATELQKAFN
ncbi:uncharacterized protein LOC134256712 [Saccostrea cucullata]|uniref:uncharacterized protein LOC134256712 n=1 Tax=Saccostrea cuccullata TaxID=36930 RepID=UPI002ED1688A